LTHVASDGSAAIGPRPRKRSVRKAWLVLALVPVFLTFGVPRFLAHDARPTGARSAGTFASLCRQHGGTPASTPGAGAGAAAQRFCTVRYGGRVYRMDAITPNGFDADTARFQRVGCEHEQSTAGRPKTFVYHPTTGVCEHRS
jgi:hypothetical protein